MKRRSQNSRRENKPKAKRRSSEIRREKVRVIKNRVKQTLGEEAAIAVGMSPTSAKAFVKAMKSRGVRADGCGCDGGKCGCKSCKTKRKPKEEGDA